MTWKKFKKLVEDANVEDDCIIESIGEVDWISIKELDVSIYTEAGINKCIILPI